MPSIDDEEVALPDPEREGKQKVYRKHSRMVTPLRYFVQSSMELDSGKRQPRKFHLSPKHCRMLDVYAKSLGVTKSQIVAFSLTMFFKRYQTFTEAQGKGKNPDPSLWFLESLMNDPEK